MGLDRKKEKKGTRHLSTLGLLKSWVVGLVSSTCLWFLAAGVHCNDAVVGGRV